MTDQLSEKVIASFELNELQGEAAKELSRDVVVTAGAGSGKTRTLVARYTGMLAKGVKPRQIAAITFTDKAAMQMRSKVRESLAKLEQDATDPQERKHWSDLSAQIDSARIGTIHSLCAEILRSHPAEAGLDPRFEVLDEGMSQVLKKQAVEDTLDKLIEEERFMPLFENLEVKELTKLLKSLLEKRYDSEEIFEISVDSRAFLATELKRRINKTPFRELIKELRNTPPVSLFNKAEDKLTVFVPELLRCWNQVEASLEQNDPAACATYLYEIRRNYLKKAGKASPAKEIIFELQDAFDQHINSLTGGKDSKDVPPSIESEQLFEELLPLLREAFERVHKAYGEQLEKRQSLDFDDLEFLAQQLLKRGDIRAHWQKELDAVMVDEYQDTNQHQRDIVNNLAGERGCLFIVGDMRQSIYRFRRADVTVFRAEKERIERANGLAVDLDLTYRQHEPLLETMSEVLANAIGIEEDPARSYYVPFTPMVAHSSELPDEIKSPHMEFIFGVGEDTASARPVAAHVLAARLLELKAEGQIKRWDEVALLFRAATSFSWYEDAFEAAGIPFVTVAGKGFYNRPEIRDLVNILRALANPADDLAFAGLLRSPAFGLSDAALYLLRSEKLSYWERLQGDLSVLSSEDQTRAARCVRILERLFRLVDRVPVAELLKQIVDDLDYRAILATADVRSSGKTAQAAGGRLWRNVDKLLEDTQTSQTATVRDFLDMLSTLDDAGAREGEAPAEADGSVRLMTVHKAKGLEYPVVVLADAGRGTRASGELVYLTKELGVTFKLDPPPILYNLAKQLEKDQEECEELRVLYVALTRAQHKLIINSHATFNKKDELSLSCWAKTLNEAANHPAEKCLNDPDQAIETRTDLEHPLLAMVAVSMPTFEEKISEDPQKTPVVINHATLLYLPVAGFGLVDEQEEADRWSEMQTWRVFGAHESVHGMPFGKLVHKALQHWLFPGDPALTALLESECYRQGLVSVTLRQSVTDQACKLLTRLRSHPLWEEINNSHERYTELPYSTMVTGKTINHIVDLLFRTAEGWHLIDFKTDAIHTAAEKEFLTNENHKYIRQVRGYQRFAQAQLQKPVRASLCFLDDRGELSLVRV